MGGLAWLNINQLGQQRELFCLTSTETRMFIRDGDKRGRGRKSEGSIAGANPEDQDALDRRQNNRMLSQCPLRHCAATSVPRNYCPNCCAEQSHKDNVRSNSSKEKLPFKTVAATGHKRPCAPKLCSLHFVTLFVCCFSILLPSRSTSLSYLCNYRQASILFP